MKKWMTVPLFALLITLLLSAACAAEDHNWVWEQGETTHIRYCDGCTAYNHTDRVIDSTSHGHHAYICKWPKTEPLNQNGFIEIGLECNLCSKPQTSQAQMRGCVVPTCRNTGSHTYVYVGGYATSKYDSETEHTYTVPTVDHKFDEYTPNNDATCTQNGTETAKCRYSYDGCTATDTREIPNSMLTHDLVKHDAKVPTCTETGWDAYETCSRNGCGYTTYQEIPALTHDYESRVVKPTCTADGYTLHTCTRCSDSYADAQTAKLNHWFGEWTPDTESGEGIQAASCRRGCGYRVQMACPRFDYTLILAGGKVTVSLCPVCGSVHDDIPLARVANATARAVRSSLPAGELTVRMGTLANGETVMSICFELSGRLTKPNGEMQITLPAELLNGYALSLLSPDGTETALTNMKNGESASFTFDFTHAETPMLLIRLVPAA